MHIHPALHESDLDNANAERLRLVTSEGLREVDTAEADPAWFNACEGMACTSGDDLPRLNWRARLSLFLTWLRACF